MAKKVKKVKKQGTTVSKHHNLQNINKINIKVGGAGGGGGYLPVGGGTSYIPMPYPVYSGIVNPAPTYGGGFIDRPPDDGGKPPSAVPINIAEPPIKKPTKPRDDEEVFNKPPPPPPPPPPQPVAHPIFNDPPRADLTLLPPRANLYLDHPEPVYNSYPFDDPRPPPPPEAPRIRIQPIPIPEPQPPTPLPIPEPEPEPSILEPLRLVRNIIESTPPDVTRGIFNVIRDRIFNRPSEEPSIATPVWDVNEDVPMAIASPIEEKQDTKRRNLPDMNERTRLERMREYSRQYRQRNRDNINETARNNYKADKFRERKELEREEQRRQQQQATNEENEQKQRNVIEALKQNKEREQKEKEQKRKGIEEHNRFMEEQVAKELKRRKEPSKIPTKIPSKKPDKGDKK